LPFDLPFHLQANSEVSALLGRIPSAVGYQPTLATDLGGLQERITTTTKGSITSVQVRVYSAFFPVTWRNVVTWRSVILHLMQLGALNCWEHEVLSHLYDTWLVGAS
jgi:hypothetical protein